MKRRNYLATATLSAFAGCLDSDAGPEKPAESGEECDALREEVTDLRRDRDRLQQRVNILEEKIRREVTHRIQDLEFERVDHAFIRSACEGIEDWDRLNIVRQMDEEYRVVSREDFKRIVEHDETNEMEYRDNIQDCVAFEASFRGNVARRYGLNSVGFVLSRRPGVSHTFNCVVFRDGSAELFEPNSGVFVEPGEELTYSLLNGVAHV